MGGGFGGRCAGSRVCTKGARQRVCDVDFGTTSIYNNIITIPPWDLDLKQIP